MVVPIPLKTEISKYKNSHYIIRKMQLMKTIPLVIMRLTWLTRMTIMIITMGSK